MKIFVSVGTHPQPFDRLLKELDSLIAAGKVKAEVFAQTGNSRYKPKNFATEKFVSGTDYENSFKNADIVVSHGGAGTIINALRQGKKLVVVPRLEKFGEHTNDHQLDLAKALENEGKCLSVYEISKLGETLAKAVRFKPKVASNRNLLVARISKFISP